MKSIEDNFCDWEGSVFGFGYGTGEKYTIDALKSFFSCLTEERSYDYRDVENKINPMSAWLIINILCHADIIEYGTSPRFGWLTKKGEALRDFLKQMTNEALIDLVCYKTEDYISCYPDHCNCHEEKCINPFWRLK